MLSKYHQHRQQLKWINRSRQLGDSLNRLGEVIVKPDSPNYETFQKLRAEQTALLDSLQAEIPWICKIIPVK